MGGVSGDRREFLWRFLLLTLPHLRVPSSSSSYFCTQLGQASPPHTADRMMYRITWEGERECRRELGAPAFTNCHSTSLETLDCQSTLLSLHIPAAESCPHGGGDPP